MGYDTTSGERNTTGQPRQTQALSCAGSTAKPNQASIMEERKVHFQNAPHPGLDWKITASAIYPKSPAAPFRDRLTSSDGQSTAHGCCVPWLAVPASDLRSASWYSPSRALRRPEILSLRLICSKTASPFGSLKLTRASPAAVAKL